MIENMKQIRTRLRETAPLIHCITNPISINQCANLVLAVDARPIMAEHPDEVQEITQIADALLLNLGNITDARLKSMVLSAETAEQKGISYVLDAVGVSCSDLRRTFLFDFLKKHHPSVIKGNYSEIYALYNGTYRSKGVDADQSLDVARCGQIAVHLAKQFQCVVLASGKTDLVTDGTRLFHIKNGTAMLARVTGTGCMLGALCASYLAGGQAPNSTAMKISAHISDTEQTWDPVQHQAARQILSDGMSPAAGNSRTLNAAILACAVLGICGELAETDRGTGTFMVNLMDKLSTLSDIELETYIKMEEIYYENL